ncbi:MAG: bacteriocin fulvocin C-related protein [Microscillaceae bacterium]|nr:bacteriocin fulvocin C-related protein [Microscillaceae bacterium]
MSLADLQSYSENDQRFVFSKLSPKQKLALWEEKFSEISELNVSIEQKKLIDEAKTILQILNFTENTPENKFIREKFANEWTKRALKTFGQSQMRLLFGTLTTLKASKINKSKKNDFIEKLIKTKAQINKAKQPECNCRWGWWCSESCSGTSCYSISGYYGGCGFLLLQTCDYVC